MTEEKNNGHLGEPLQIAATMMVQSWCFRFNESELRFMPDGTVTFRGNADEAATAFFDKVIKLHNHHYVQLRAENHQLKRRVEELQDAAGVIPKE